MAAALKLADLGISPIHSIASLRGWLQGAWGLLFSHPDDFACYGFEVDRWIVHVREAFEATRVRPLALVAPGQNLSSMWLEEVGGCGIAIRPRDTQQCASSPVTAQPLVRAIASATTRFVMVLDEALHPRRTYAYTPGDRLPSPIELAGMAEALRLTSPLSLASPRPIAARAALGRTSAPSHISSARVAHLSAFSRARHRDL